MYIHILVYSYNNTRERKAVTIVGRRLQSVTIEEIENEVTEASLIVQKVMEVDMDDLLKLPDLGSNCQVKDLRAVLDQLTIHVRGLESLGISAQQYGSLLTPIVMSKLPPDVRLLDARNAKGSLLELGSIMQMLKGVEAREASFSLKTQESNFGNKGSWGKGRNNGNKNISTAAFLANLNNQTSNIKCAFCSKQHFSASCEHIKDIGEHREILMSVVAFCVLKGDTKPRTVIVQSYVVSATNVTTSRSVI